MTHLDQLKHRVTLLRTSTKADSEGKPTVSYQSLGFAWADIQILSPKSRTYLAWVKSALKQPPPPLYEVWIRERKKDIHSSGTFGRHEEINALRWKSRVFDVICPFTSAGREGTYWKALCKEKGENYG